MKTMMIVALLALLALAGCNDKKSSEETGDKDRDSEKSSDKKKASKKKKGGKTVTASTKPKSFPKLKCGDDWPKTEQDGKVFACVVLEDTPIADFKCAKMGRVELHPDGALKSCKLTKDRSLSGVPCKKDRSASFFPTGELRECAVQKDSHTISGVTCRYRVDMHKNGELRRCQIDAKATLGDYTAPAESWVTLFPSGKVERIEFAKGSSLAFKDFKCVQTYHYESGAVKICSVAEKMKYKGKVLPLNTSVCFDEKGTQVDDIDAVCLKL